MANGSDDQVLEEFFQAVTPTIEDLVTRAVQQGQRVKELAVVLERKFNGEVAADCVARSAIGGRLRAVQGVDDVSRRRIVAQVKHAPDHEVPAVLFVHGEGFVSVGIKRLAGRMAWLS
jgi:hypothetical protein